MRPRPRLLFYIQHLLGIGHVVRGGRIAAALAAGPFDVTVVVGGLLPGGLDFGDAAVVCLPPVKAGPGGFADLVAPDGRVFGKAERAARRDLLLACFDRIAPDVLLVETFPFGRRQMRFELLPLLDRARACPGQPLVVSSVRDIVQENRKAGRDEEAVGYLDRYFDLAIVHGDPALTPFEASFRLAGRLGDKLAYSGLVGPAGRGALPSERSDVIVSAGGGAVGAALLHCALAARPLSRLSNASWLFVTGPNTPEAKGFDTGPGVTVRTFVPDLASRFRSAQLSISQAGYNTIADLLSAPGCRIVLVPHAARGETEQARRASLLAERHLAVTLDEDQLDPGAMATAIGRALDLPPRPKALDLDGAAETCRIIERRLRERRPS